MVYLSEVMVFPPSRRYFSESSCRGFHNKESIIAANVLTDSDITKSGTARQSTPIEPWNSEKIAPQFSARGFYLTKITLLEFSKSPKMMTVISDELPHEVPILGSYIVPV